MTLIFLILHHDCINKKRLKFSRYINFFNLYIYIYHKKCGLIYIRIELNVLIKKNYKTIILCSSLKPEK